MHLFETVKEIIKLIKKNKVIVCPTDTVYGLICDATSKKAIRKLFKIKKRDFAKPIPIFIANIKMAKKLASVNKKQEKFLGHFWPGKITIVLKSKKKFPRGVLNKENNIGLRIPDYELLNLLLKKLNVPLSATSANISGQPASTKIEEVINQFQKEEVQPDLIIDVGNLKPAHPSTVVDLTRPEMKILRIGDIKKEKIIRAFR
jgi:L-threonylcarbamoyladenylate synthase